MTLTYAKPERVWLKTHPDLNERWLQDRIGEDPSLLGLGDLVLEGSRAAASLGAGRLDLLLQDAEDNRRYEVEIQLGKTDESHIIRTIEYWDIERKRYPQYDHIGVIVAEDITSRFLNVIGLFNGVHPAGRDPAAAPSRSATRSRSSSPRSSTRCSSVSSTRTRKFRGQPTAPTGRSAAPKRRSPWRTSCSSWLHDLDPGLELKYNKFYIGLAKDGRPNNFVTFRPRKDWVLAELRIERSDETQAQLETAGIEVLEYDARYRAVPDPSHQGRSRQEQGTSSRLMRRAHGDGE